MAAAFIVTIALVIIVQRLFNYSFSTAVVLVVGAMAAELLITHFIVKLDKNSRPQ